MSTEVCESHSFCIEHELSLPLMILLFLVSFRGSEPELYGLRKPLREIQIFRCFGFSALRKVVRVDHHFFFCLAEAVSLACFLQRDADSGWCACGFEQSAGVDGI